MRGTQAHTRAGSCFQGQPSCQWESQGALQSPSPSPVRTPAGEAQGSCPCLPCIVIPGSPANPRLCVAGGYIPKKYFWGGKKQALTSSWRRVLSQVFLEEPLSTKWPVSHEARGLTRKYLNGIGFQVAWSACFGKIGKNAGWRAGRPAHAAHALPGGGAMGTGCFGRAGCRSKTRSVQASAPFKGRKRCS